MDIRTIAKRPDLTGHPCGAFRAERSTTGSRRRADTRPCRRATETAAGPRSGTEGRTRSERPPGSPFVHHAVKPIQKPALHMGERWGGWRTGVFFPRPTSADGAGDGCSPFEVVSARIAKQQLPQRPNHHQITPFIHGDGLPPGHSLPLWLRTSVSRSMPPQ